MYMYDTIKYVNILQIKQLCLKKKKINTLNNYVILSTPVIFNF